MHLSYIPLYLLLAGLVLYTVLGGADFGAGIWELTTRTDEEVRGHAVHAMGPVWEANHVWLIFVLVVLWTAYPVAFASIASTLAIPFFVAAIGIILRGTAYALRAGAYSTRELAAIDTVFSISSILTPFALGAAAGAVASRRVPVGNAAGDLVSTWLNPTSLTIGALAVTAGAYLAAVFLAADAVRRGQPSLERAYRLRALAAGVAAGALAIAAIFVVRSDAKPLFHGLVHGRGLVALIVSVAAGAATLALVAGRRYEPARFTAALAVAAIVAGWALAQAPLLLPGLTVDQAAAPRDTLIALTVAALAGAVILLPSLWLLFRLYLQGRFDPEWTNVPGPSPPPRTLVAASGPGVAWRLATVLLVAGVALTTIAGAAWAHAIGVACLLGAVAAAFPEAATPPRSG
ncbi:MAG TPA: cytochrome d ubiquinol oxidase subunit II [Gaiellaceae bacterium]|nr:cytochrome d ubiquinol oxidase subunit II [Gaiellaceae bacterium]